MSGRIQGKNWSSMQRIRMARNSLLGLDSQRRLEEGMWGWLVQLKGGGSVWK